MEYDQLIFRCKWKKDVEEIAISLSGTVGELKQHVAKAFDLKQVNLCGLRRGKLPKDEVVLSSLTNLKATPKFNNIMVIGTKNDIVDTERAVCSTLADSEASTTDQTTCRVEELKEEAAIELEKWRVIHAERQRQRQQAKQHTREMGFDLPCQGHKLERWSLLPPAALAPVIEAGLSFPLQLTLTSNPGQEPLAPANVGGAPAPSLTSLSCIVPIRDFSAPKGTVLVPEGVMAQLNLSNGDIAHFSVVHKDEQDAVHKEEQDRQRMEARA